MFSPAVVVVVVVVVVAVVVPPVTAVMGPVSPDISGVECDSPPDPFEIYY